MSENELKDYLASVINKFIDVPILNEEAEGKLARHLVEFIFNVGKLFGGQVGKE